MEIDEHAVIELGFPGRIMTISAQLGADPGQLAADANVANGPLSGGLSFSSAILSVLAT